MNKKLITLAVAGAFVAPAAALAQSSNVQVFGTMYLEYAYAKQGNYGGPTATGLPSTGQQVNVDVLQSPGSEIGIKGEEALGGGMVAWFQCASTADIRGGVDGATAGFCSRNSAIGVKGRFGNAYAGNWDMPMKKVAGSARMLSDTGIWGVGRMLFGDSSTFGNGSTGINTASGIAFSRRQNSSLFYDTPNFSGFQGYFGVSTTTKSANIAGTVQSTVNASGSKPRMWGAAGTYTNGPLYVMLGYEKHNNYAPGFGAFGGAGAYSGDDTAWQVGATYQFGPVKVGAVYVQRKYDMVANGAADLKVNTWNLAGEWNIAGPHALRGGYTRAEDTKGNAGSGVATGGVTNVASLVGGTAGGGLVGNGGAGQTGGSLWQIQYVYNASKRTEFTAGYISLHNDSFARYSLGGIATAGGATGLAGGPAGGTSQSAFAVSMKNTF